MGIQDYSTNPNANTAQMPEGQAPSTVNNGVRDVQADLATDYNDPGWYRPGAPAPTITRISGNSFRVPGVDMTALYHQGRRVRVAGATTGTIYGRIDTPLYTGGNTDVSITLDSGTIQAETITVSLATHGTGANTALPLGRQSWAGILELLNAAEYQTGTDAVRALTVATMADGWTIGPPPLATRFKLPLGIEVEFGSAVSSTQHAFLADFAAPPIVVVSAYNTSTGAFYAVASSITVSSFGARTFTQGDTLSGTPVGYIAIGIGA